MSSKTLVVILGATATGKTELSIEIARRFGSPIISCDSRQIYHEIPIGTAAATREEQAMVKHYFVGTRSVTENYNCGRFETEALQLLEELFTIHDTVIMVGGSGLYIDAVCDGIDDVPSTNQLLRASIQARLETEGLDVLLRELEVLDPEYYLRVDKCNPVRVTRALEICLETGKPYSNLRQGRSKQRNFRIVKIGTRMERDLLYARINKRVDMMIEQGLVLEAQSVYHLRKCNALQTVGYKELFDYFDGAVSISEAIELIKRNSRRYAKRQTTWFGRDEQISWFDKNEFDSVENHIKNFV